MQIVTVEWAHQPSARVFIAMEAHPFFCDYDIERQRIRVGTTNWRPATENEVAEVTAFILAHDIFEPESPPF